MIVREGDEVRVERDDWRLLLESAVVGACVLIIVVSMLVTAIPSRRLGAAGLSLGIVALMALLAIRTHRKRDVLVLRLDQLGYTSGKKMLWVARDSIERVKVVHNMFGADVLLFGPDGRVVARPMLFQLTVKQLREAVREAGYPLV